MHIGYPYRIDSRGRTARPTDHEHIRELIEQVLFTTPGERVNRPDFGSGLQQLVFAPASDEMTTTTQFLVQGALQQWLGDVIQVEAVQVQSEEATLRVTVQYIVRSNQQRHAAHFERGNVSP
jgi:hypothetical protein